MIEVLNYNYVVEINAGIKKVWDALVNPEITRMYMFGCGIESTWEPGSPVTWKGGADGVVYVKGEVLAFEPYNRLSLTTFSPHSGLPDVPENYLTGEYLLEENSPGKTTLKITQGDFNRVENGKARFEEAHMAWVMSMQKMKEILETDLISD